LLELDLQQRGWLDTLNIKKNVRRAFNAIISEREIDQSVLRSAWKYLGGEKVDSSELNTLRVAKPQLNNAEEFASVIDVIAKTYKVQGNKLLIYLIDECDKLKILQMLIPRVNGSISFRNLLDLQDVGFIFAAGAEGIRNIPSILQAQEILRRIGSDYMQELQAFNRPRSRGFLRGLFNLVVDKDKLKVLATIKKMGAKSFV